MSNKIKDKCFNSEAIYGRLPDRPDHLDVDLIGRDNGFAGGYAALNNIQLVLEVNEMAIGLPIHSVIPKTDLPCPAIIHLGYEDAIPNRFLPAEEIIERGYAIFNINVNDVSPISPDFKSGAAARISLSRRKSNAPGKLCLWAWAARVVVDYVCKLDNIDKESIIIAGHGICGEAAMICAESDERIRYVIANEVIQRGNHSTDTPYLFSPSYAGGDTEDRIKMLIAACVDKYILLGAAAGAPLADSAGDRELIAELISENALSENKIHYHSRRGTEYFSRKDWSLFLDFIDDKSGNKPSFDNICLHF